MMLRQIIIGSIENNQRLYIASTENILYLVISKGSNFIGVGIINFWKNLRLGS